MKTELSRRAVIAGISALAVAARVQASTERSVITLQPTATRSSEISVWRARGRRRGTILFSHGAMSSPRMYPGLIGPWSDAGYDVFAPLHVDSLEHPETAKYPGLASWATRLEDMRALSAHVGAKSCIAAGHSYGGLVALTLGGAEAIPPPGITRSLRDPRVRAVLAFSPPAPIPVLITAEGYGKLAVPALIQTGDRDVPPGSNDVDGWRLHLTPYDAAVAGGSRYALVLSGVDHYFGGAICKFDLPGPPQIAQLEVAARISTQFLDAYGAGRASARRALDRQLSDSGPAILKRK